MTVDYSSIECSFVNQSVKYVGVCKESLMKVVLRQSIVQNDQRRERI